MDPTPAAAGEDEPVVVVEITPRIYRVRGVLAIVAGLAGLVLVIVAARTDLTAL